MLRETWKTGNENPVPWEAARDGGSMPVGVCYNRLQLGTHSESQ
jgi:hypothetical protein